MIPCNDCPHPEYCQVEGLCIEQDGDEEFDLEDEADTEDLDGSER